MKKLSFPLVSLLFLSLALTASARPGGGRSSQGSRGSRGAFRAAPRYPQARPQYEPPRPQTSPRPAPTPYQAPPQAAPQGGGFLRNFGAGLAGGFLGSLLFRGMGGRGYDGYGYGHGGGGGFGFLELIVLILIGYFLLRFIRNRASFQSAGGPDIDRIPSWQSRPVPEPIQAEVAEPDVVTTLAKYDPDFNLPRFKDARLDDFFRIQAAFMNRDFATLKGAMGQELYAEIERDLTALKNAGRANRLDQITIRDADIVEAWHEPGREFATLRVVANLLDYTIDEATGNVVEGSKTEPVKFEEYWTFARNLGPGIGTRWYLSGIDQGDTL